jgi:transcriptional regulator with XRE-family HTH domain
MSINIKELKTYRVFKIKEEHKKELLNGVSQRDIADKIGINEATLSRILNGKQNCSKLTARSLVILFRKEQDIDYYFERVGE